jgi:hypothetical protein
MPLPERFDINSFDNVDLWSITRILAERVSGLHVARIFSPKYDAGKGMTYMRAFLYTPESGGQQIEFANADFRGTAEKMKALKLQAELAMGVPKTYDNVVWDEAPERTADPDLQLETAQEFLPYIGRTSLVNVVRRESDNKLIRLDAVAQATLNTSRPTVQAIETHAKINVQLAAQVGENLAPYEEIVRRAASWEPINSIPPEMGWLTR